ncbi:MAG: phosphate ABC transporter permease subunit PstC [Lachnospiraceae bacterium]|nr:phosphate ABC transporter permease subunit PstC [Lachnospiraceae bacterium]
MNRLTEKIIEIIFGFAAVMCIVAVVIICFFLFRSGIPAIGKIGLSEFLFGMKWKPGNELFGIFPMIVGSIIVTGLSVLLGVPIGILSAVFMVFYCPIGMYRLIKPIMNLLAGIPSIVYGFFGLVVLVPIMQELFGNGGKSLMTASLLLGIMILPTVISVTESSLRAVPASYYEGALALGASHERSIFKTVLPAAKSGVMAGVILGVGRSIGETMAVSMVAGNQPVIPENIFSGVRTLTANIVLEMGYAADLHREALIATAVVLFAFILVINLCFSIIKRRKVR